MSSENTSVDRFVDPALDDFFGLGRAVGFDQGGLLTDAVKKQPHSVVILDEIHHAGTERAWGDGVGHAFELAARRLALSGTPFRSDQNPIPFVDYDFEEAVAHYT
jgi:superfamily II DNA or RNA helicase